MKLAVRDGGHGHWRQAGSWVGKRGSTGELALRKSRAERFVRSNGGIHGAIRNTGGDGGFAHCAKQTSLKRFHVGRMDAEQIGDAAGQNVTEKSEAGTKHGLRLKLPGDSGSRLQNGQRR